MSSLGKGISAVGKFAAGIATAAAAGATALLGLANSASQTLDRVDKLSAKIGISKQAFQEWDYILGQNGMDVEKLQVGLKTLTAQMDMAAEGNANAIKNFDALGLSWDDGTGKLKSQEEMMEETIIALANMEDITERNRLATELFGKAGQEMLPMLNSGAEGIEELRGRAHELGLVMSDEMVDAGVVFGDTLDDAKQAVKAVGTTIGGSLLPSLTQGLNAFIAFFTGAEGGKEMMDEAFTGIVATITEILPQFIEKGSQIILSIVQGLASALPSLVTGVMGIIPSIASTIMAMLPDIIRAGVEVIAAVVSGIASALPQLIPAAVETITQLVLAFVESLPLLIDAALQLIMGLAQGLLDAIPVLVAAIPTIILAIIDAVLAAIPQIIQTGIDLLTSLVTSLPIIVQSIVTAIPTIIDGIINALLENLPLIVQAGVDLLVSLIQNLPTIIITIVEALPQIITGIVEGIVSNIPMIVQAGVDLLTSLITNLPTIIIEIVKAVPLIIAGIVEGFASLAGSIMDIGKNLLEGIWQGICNAAGWLWDQITGFFGGIVDGIMGFFGISSPSKVFAEIGDFLMLGLGMGINRTAHVVAEAVQHVSDNVVTGIEHLADAANGAINTLFSDPIEIDANLNANGGFSGGAPVPATAGGEPLPQTVHQHYYDIRVVGKESNSTAEQVEELKRMLREIIEGF